MPHTLANTLAAHESIYVNSGHPMCCKSTKLDIQALIDRLGPNHGFDASGSGRAVRLLGLQDCGQGSPAGVFHGGS